jgi:hypothetical protein
MPHEHQPKTMMVFCILHFLPVLYRLYFLAMMIVDIQTEIFTTGIWSLIGPWVA